MRQKKGNTGIMREHQALREATSWSSESDPRWHMPTSLMDVSMAFEEYDFGNYGKVRATRRCNVGASAQLHY